jgi:thioredoxin-like negative regulator of GroEL
MAPPESVPRIQHDAQLATECVQWSTSRTPVLLQVGSEACVKCPAFTEAFEALHGEYEFAWRYCDAHADGDIPEAHGISKLPAVVIVRDGASEIAEGIDAARLREMVRGLCARKRPVNLNLFDADF